MWALVSSGRRFWLNQYYWISTDSGIPVWTSPGSFDDEDNAQDPPIESTLVRTLVGMQMTGNVAVGADVQPDLAPYRWSVALHWAVGTDENDVALMHVPVATGILVPMTAYPGRPDAPGSSERIIIPYLDPAGICSSAAQRLPDPTFDLPIWEIGLVNFGVPEIGEPGFSAACFIRSLWQVPGAG